ncbi:MAG: hypothetical protein IMZ71_04340, partial [Chloroflexi bacterium]|nr:hypothetical protein [Chloroflexota bacterium]
MAKLNPLNHINSEPPRAPHKRALSQAAQQLEEFRQNLAIRLVLWSTLVTIAGVILLLVLPSFARGFGLALLPSGLAGLILAARISLSVRNRFRHPPSQGVTEPRARSLRRLLWRLFLLDLLVLAGSLILALWSGSGLPASNRVFWQGIGWGLSCQSLFFLYFT